MLKFLANFIFYFFLFGFLGRVIADLFVGLLKEMGWQSPAIFSNQTFVGGVLWLLLAVSVVLAKITPTEWLDDD